MSATMRFAIDGGGTTTRLAIAGPSHSLRDPLVFPSINPASVNAAEAVTLLREVLGHIAKYATRNGSPSVEGIVASAAISAHTVDHWADVTADALSGMGMTCTVALTNDIDGLVLAPPINGEGGVLVAGTGSGATVVDREGRVVRVGGWEYLASDEGSAFWLGRTGLAMAVRSVDGRGPSTSLAPRIEARLGGSLGDVVRRLAELPQPRQAVADVAHCVTEAWTQENDEVATELIHSAVDELASLVRAGRHRAAGPSPAWALTGGLVTQCAAFAQLLRDRVQVIAPESVVHVVAEPASCLLERPLAPLVPPGLPRRIVKVKQ